MSGPSHQHPLLPSLTRCRHSGTKRDEIGAACRPCSGHSCTPHERNQPADPRGAFAPTRRAASRKHTRHRPCGLAPSKASSETLSEWGSPGEPGYACLRGPALRLAYLREPLDSGGFSDTIRLLSDRRRPMSSATLINTFAVALRAAAPKVFAIALLVPGAVPFWHSSAVSAEAAVVIPAPTTDGPRHGDAETAVLAGGCFWGVQGVFQHVKGVTSAVSGYSGGASETARYESVGSGRTGHAEAVEVTFDPHQVSFGQILQIYFSVVHDPTELNRQGPDVGPQYRSAIFAANPSQLEVVRAYISQLSQARTFPKPIVTTADGLTGFYSY